VTPENTETLYPELLPYRPGKKVWFIAVGLLLLYMFVYMNYPKIVRYMLVALPALTAAAFLCREVKIWMLALPIVITFGGKAFEFGLFYTCPATIAILFAGGVYLVHTFAGFRKTSRMPVTFYIVGAAYLAQAASIFASIYLHDSLLSNTLREGNKLFISAILLPIIYHWYGRGVWLVRLLKVLTALLFIMSLFGVYQYTSGNIDSLGELASGFDLAGRVYSTISGGPNSYSGVLELLVPTVLASMFLFKSKIWKFIAFITVVLGILNVLYTFSRGGFLTVTGACLLYLVYRFRSRIWIPALSLAIFVGFIVNNASEFERQLTLFGNVRSLMMDTSLLHRYTSYKRFAAEIADDPIIGTGWGGSEYFHGRTSLYGFWEVRHEDSVDKIDRFGGLNTLVLEMPLKGGFFSALALLLMFSAFAVTGVKLLNSGVDSSTGFGFMCGLLGFGMHQLFDNLIPWPQTGAFFWIVFGLMIAMAYPCCDEREYSL